MAFPLTFGVELELVLGFHRTLLEEELKKVPVDSRLHIVENPGKVKRKCLSRTPYYDKAYNGWALCKPNETTDVPYDVALLDADTQKPTQYRGYLSEPLGIAQTILRKTQRLTQTACHTDLGKQSDFSQWTLVRDASVDSLERSDLSATFENDQRPKKGIADWDSCGIELVSPVFSNPLTARKDVEEAITALQGIATSNHSVVANEQTGLHVHVGSPDGFSTTTLQHLALLVTVYEHEFDRLHPLPRRTTQTNEEITTNRENFFLEGAESVRSSDGSKWLWHTYKPIHDIKSRIFDNGTANRRDALVGLMGRCKRHVVNFSYSNRTPEQGPATVEFRQHAGTTDPDDVYHWTKHCLALVRLAQRYATIGAECPIQSWDDDISLEGLWEEMELEQETRAFYRAKMAVYEQMWPEWKPTALWVEDKEGPRPPIEDLTFEGLTLESGKRLDSFLKE